MQSDLISQQERVFSRTKELPQLTRTVTNLFARIWTNCTIFEIDQFVVNWLPNYKATLKTHNKSMSDQKIRSVMNDTARELRTHKSK